MPRFDRRINLTGLARAHLPDEIAILGVDNDEMICDFAPLPLSSVGPGSAARRRQCSTGS